jgi:cob(I)alamin adenosyltransferase
MKEIKNARHISTKTGDEGFSRNYSNDKLRKTDVLFETVGNIDEFSSMLGVCYHQTVIYKEEIVSIQKDLQNIMSLIATNYEDKNYDRLTQITINDISNLESIEQSILDHKPLQPKFVLPGSDSSIEGSYFDLSRAIARRCERSVLRFKEYNKREDLGLVLKYLNRVSDLLFIMARSFDK